MRPTEQEEESTAAVSLCCSGDESLVQALLAVSSISVLRLAMMDFSSLVSLLLLLVVVIVVIALDTIRFDTIPLNQGSIEEQWKKGT